MVLEQLLARHYRRNGRWRLATFAADQGSSYLTVNGLTGLILKSGWFITAYRALMTCCKWTYIFMLGGCPRIYPIGSWLPWKSTSSATSAKAMSPATWYR